ncbi:hypothetical protein MN608_05333 [Microdochium nivale]|nr:hypothetical protein MN608_05333 [Microdochium nivale]
MQVQWQPSTSKWLTTSSPTTRRLGRITVRDSGVAILLHWAYYADLALCSNRPSSALLPYLCLICAVPLPRSDIRDTLDNVAPLPRNPPHNMTIEAYLGSTFQITPPF